MQENTPQNTPRDGGEQRRKLMRVARTLFGERGIGNVSVRDIARAAGQRNMGIVGYYFGTKEQLVTDILMTGVGQIEEMRNALLDRLERADRQPELRDIIGAIIRPLFDFADENPLEGRSFILFMIQLALSDTTIVQRMLIGDSAASYRRCLDHLRRLMPHLSRAEQDRRFTFLGAYIFALVAARERTMSNDAPLPSEIWSSEVTLQDIMVTAEAILISPIAQK